MLDILIVMAAKRFLGHASACADACVKKLQVREGVRSLAEVLALAREIEACPALHLRGLATHHGRLEVFAPIVAALRSNVSQARALLPRC